MSTTEEIKVTEQEVLLNGDVEQSSGMDGLVQNRCCKFPQIVREMVAEMMGTFILIMFGVGSVAQFYFGQQTLGVPFLSVNFGWALGVMFGVYWSAGVSGGHINPAVTLAMVVSGRLPLKKLPFYWIGQTLGAFIGSALCYALYYDLLSRIPEQGRYSISTAGIWSTYPAEGVSHGTIFGDQLIATALLVGCVFALTDKRNNPPSAGILPLCIGMIVLGIGISFGINVGYGINPARDLIPRIFTAMAGWKEAPFKYQDSFFYIPILGQLLGGVLGGLLYTFTIEMHHPADSYNVVTKTVSSDNTKVETTA